MRIVLARRLFPRTPVIGLKPVGGAVRLGLACVLMAAALIGALAGAAPARADVLVTVDKAQQLVSVRVNGRLKHVWPVSTGLRGGPPVGAFRPTRMHRTYFSRTYDNAPMPHSIFFHHGFAIHGTNHVSRLGRPASKGCVRLHPRNAARLFDMVRRAGMKSTRIVVVHGPRIGRHSAPERRQRVSRR